MIKYPLYFEAKAKSEKGMNTTFEGSVEDLPPITGAIPKEFNGPGGGYSPEDLYLLAIATCLIATFKVFAERTKFEYSEIECLGKLTIDRNEKGVPELKKVDLTFSLKGVKDQEKAKALLAESEKYCLVSNAVKSQKSFAYQFA